MKTTLTTDDIAEALYKDEYGGWSRGGAFAMAEWLEEMEEGTGEEMELDVVAIRCDFSEYESLQDWAGSYWGTIGGACQVKAHFGWDDDIDDEEKEDSIREYVNDHGHLIEFDGGVIVSSF